MSSNRDKIIIVLGMHRAGTSAITRSLQVLGARLGDQFCDPQEDNPKGFWEDKDLMDLNVEMFDSLGMAWNRLTPITKEEVATLMERGFLEKAHGFLNKKLGRGGIVALKHPGTAKIFPFWKEAFARCECEVNYLLTVRHPLSVAKSLARRDGIQKCYGTLMWLAHVIPSLSVPKGSRALVTDYDLFMSNPTSELGRIAHCFQLEVKPGELKSYLDEFLDSGLRHSSFVLSDLETDPDLPSLVSEVYRGLRDLASDRVRLEDSKSVDMIHRWAAEFEGFHPFLKFIETITAERDHQAILLDNATREIAWRDASISWRMTRPLRQLRTLSRTVFGSGRTAGKL
ncbi:MAG: hypothetical protein WCQ57_02680 [Verrucomicrobiota bacterium]